MSEDYKEIEIKHPLKNADKVLLKLKELGAEQKLSHQIQEDIYYVPTHRNFLDEEIVSEWLRVRKTDKGYTFNLKRWQPIGAKVQTHADEYETQVSDVEALQQILFHLDFKEIVTVHKDRSTWILDNIEIAIDVVRDLGAFIELELKEITSDMEKAHEKLNLMLEKLSAEVLPRDKRGYPYQLLNM